MYGNLIIFIHCERQLLLAPLTVVPRLYFYFIFKTTSEPYDRIYTSLKNNLPKIYNWKYMEKLLILIDLN